jgi:hypothetical protein
LYSPLQVQRQETNAWSRDMLPFKAAHEVDRFISEVEEEDEE